MTFNVTSPKRATAFIMQSLNNNWVKFFFIYRLTIFKIFFELKALNGDEYNGGPIKTIPLLDGSDTIKVMTRISKIVCVVSARLAVSN